MSSKSERKKGVILSYVSIFFVTLLQLVYLPFLTNKLGTSEYGLFSLVSSIIGYLVVLDFGFGDAIIQFTIQYHEKNEYNKEQKLHGMFLLIYSIIGIIAFLLGMIIFFSSDAIFAKSMTPSELYKMKPLIFILSLNLALTFPFSIYSSLIRAYEKFTFQKTLSIIHSVLQPIIMIPLLLLGYKSICLTLVITFLNVFVLLSNYIYCKKKLKIKIKYLGFDKNIFKEIFSYSFYIFLNVIIDKINWSTDQTILGIVAGTAQVSIYAVASRINEMFIKLSTAVSGILFPKIAKMVTNNASDEELTKEFIKTGRIQYIIIFLMTSGLVIFGKKFFLLWLGNEYSNAYYVALLLIIPISIPLIQNLGISILQAKKIHKFRSIIYMIFSIFNIIWSIPLSNKYGAMGAAFGTGLSLIIGNGIIINFYYYKKAKINIIKFWKEILKMTVPFTVPVVIITVLIKFISINNWITLLLLCFIYSITYLIICYLFSMNKYEKEIINNLLLKVRKGKI